MKETKRYLKSLQKAQRVLDHFTVRTARTSSVMLANGKEFDSEALIDLVIKMQELEALIGLTLLRIKC